ncbi:Retrovirus-related Pol polyprotein from transposon RE1 [Bienertia sinuspersici]
MGFFNGGGEGRRRGDDKARGGWNHRCEEGGSRRRQGWGLGAGGSGSRWGAEVVGFFDFLRWFCGGLRKEGRATVGGGVAGAADVSEGTHGAGGVGAGDKGRCAELFLEVSLPKKGDVGWFFMVGSDKGVVGEVMVGFEERDVMVGGYQLTPRVIWWVFMATNDNKIDVSSPFYLGSGDQPGNLITHLLLKSDNYVAWSRAITLSLKARRKFGFVDGSISKPTDSTTLLDWETVNSMVVSWILRSIEPKLVESIPFHDNAKQLWDYLDKRFCIANGPRIQQLRAQIADCRQTKSMSVEDFYNKLIGLYDELYRLKPLHACSCGQCSCDVVGRFAADRREEIFHQFLLGIDDDYYGSVRSNLLSQVPPADLDRAYQAFIQEERSRTIARAKVIKDESHVFVVQPRSDRAVGAAGGSRGVFGGIPRIDKSKLYCDHCQRSGHDRSSCFVLNGFPQWYLDLRRRSRDNAAPPTRGPGTAASGQHRPSAAPAPVPVAATAQPIRGSTSAARAHFVHEPYSSTSALNISSDAPSASIPTPNFTERMAGKCPSTGWIIDTGASHHVTGDDSSLFDTKIISPWPVGLPNGSRSFATLVGRVALSSHLTLENVLFVPDLCCNLISVSQLIDDSNCLVSFTNSVCVIQDLPSRMQIGAGERRDGLYYFHNVPVICAVSPPPTDFELWHRRLGHPSDRVLKLVPPLKGISGKKCLNKACVVCPMAKQTRDIFPTSDSRASRVFELVHCDLWGPYTTPSSCDAIYFLTLVDDFSRAVWVYLLVTKTEVYAAFSKFFAMVERQFETIVKFVRSDNGTEFRCMIPYFDANGIIFQTSCVGTPQQNGRVERKHQHILNVSRALRFQAHLPISFWGECVLAAVYIINRTPSSVLNGKSPYELLFGKSALLDELRVFGCLCFAHNQRAKGDKFSSRSRRCIFVGYPSGKKGWKVYDLDTNEFFVSRDVRFYEYEFPFAQSEVVDHTGPVGFNDTHWLPNQPIIHDDSLPPSTAPNSSSYPSSPHTHASSSPNAFSSPHSNDPSNSNTTSSTESPSPSSISPIPSSYMPSTTGPDAPFPPSPHLHRPIILTHGPPFCTRHYNPKL